MTNIDSMLLPDLKKVASSLGLKGTGQMRKAELQAAIRAAQGGAPAGGGGEPRGRTPGEQSAHQQDQTAPAASETASAHANGRRRARREAGAPDSRPDAAAGGSASDEVAARLSGLEQGGQGGDDVASRLEALEQGGRRTRDRGERNPGGADDPSQQQAQDRTDDYGNDEGGSGRRNRRRRNRDRNNRRNRGGNTGLEKMESEPTLAEGDVLVEVSGILDVLDSYAFVRTSGYLPGPNDAYVSLSMVRKNGLRKGDIVTGAMRAQREGERQKYSPLVRIDTINADDPAKARDRAEFNKLTPLYPQERLRLETTPTNMTGRIVDLVAPIGKGQRGLIVSPPKAGKTMVMQSIANSIAQNNPEVHLMVVLVDERPEEVTDFQRSVAGEVIASTFDRPADDHTTVAELAIERAKRLVEMGKDVVILLDGITRLSRAYNLAAPASGRILSGGVDSAALYPPKRFFGAARNVEHGGSLTILATALVETGSKMDEVIFEEFKGTGNMELRLRREMADKRIFPAIDAVASGTRREEQLLTREELAIIWKLRRVLSGLEDQAALEMLINRLKKTQTNLEFLHVISRTTPSND